MTNILDLVSSTLVLEIDDWPRSATLKEWFAITRRIIQDTIDEMNLDPPAEVVAIEALTCVGLPYISNVLNYVIISIISYACRP